MKIKIKEPKAEIGRYLSLKFIFKQHNFKNFVGILVIILALTYLVITALTHPDQTQRVLALILLAEGAIGISFIVFLGYLIKKQKVN